MRRKFLRTLVMLFAAFAPMFVVVSQDELKEFDVAYIQREVLKESAESLATQRNQQTVYFSPGVAIIRSRYSPSAAITPSRAFSAFSTCILRC
jgi:hypothetical protein